MSAREDEFLEYVQSGGQVEATDDLPDDYRAFLLRYNGGRPTLPRFTFTADGEEQESVLEWFLAVHDQPYEEPDDWDPDTGELPP